jgi:tRNA-specific adenosine deaminase 1
MKRLFEEEEEEEKDDLSERVSSACYEKFNLLSFRGKPLLKEWTHLSGFISINEKNEIDVLSIGTGRKCLGGEKEERGIFGCLLHDSHAEVIARRSLIRFFYEEMIKKNTCPPCSINEISSSDSFFADCF